MHKGLFVLVTAALTCSGWAASEPPCERYAVHELMPGVTHDSVLVTMGGEGVESLIRIPGSGETSGVEYSAPDSNVYVEYDRRVDRRTRARVVRVRASMPLLPTTVQTLVGEFGPPDAGADKLVEGLREGAAVWVQEDCGVVLSAYRSPASWWTAGGGTFLQVETLDLARQEDSPASPRLGEILARKHEPAAVPAPAMSETLPAPPPMLSVQITAGVDKASPAPLPEARAIPPPPPPVAKPPGTNKPVDGPAERITFAPPVYPAAAKWLGVKGHVTLAVDVRADGSAANRPRVVTAHPAGRGFEAAAIDAVRMWRFKPAIRGGRPVASSLRIDVDFD